MVGFGGEAGAANGWAYGVHTRRLVTFSLEGSTRLPSLPPPTVVTPMDAPGFTVDPVLLPVGGNDFERTCAACHGGGAVAAGMAPDLRASAIVLSEEAFASVVRDGVRASRGMPEYADLTDRQLLALRHYIRYSAGVSGGEP